MSASQTSPHSHLAAETASQPQNWLDARRTAQDHRSALPQPGEKVAIVGCGTSLHMARAFAAMREDEGHGLTDAWSPTEARLDRGYDRLVAITRSGTTTEVVELLAAARDRLPATVICSSAGTPALELATPLLTPEVDERSVVQTRFATTTLAMLRWHLGHDLTVAADQARGVLAQAPASLGAALTADQITFLGRDWTVGLAEEAALKLRESAQQWTESYSMTEYRHGPISIGAPGRAVWLFGEPVPGLAEEVTRTGADLVQDRIDPMADLVRVHRLCAILAHERGLDPDRPRHLTRSVVLPG